METTLITHRRRPIGLFPALFRVWAAVRAGIVKQWDAGPGAASFFSTGEGRGAPDTSWRTAARAATSSAQGGHFLEACWDVSKAFERVEFARLRQAAAQVGYPGWLLGI